MKAHIIIIALFLILQNYSYAQYSWVEQSGITNMNLHSVRFMNESRGFIGGDNGTLLRTSNGGLTWESRRVPNNTSVNSIAIKNQIVWITGDYGLIALSTDYAQTWQIRETGTIEKINHISITGNTLQSVCNNGIILKSTNNGTNWFRVYSPVAENLNCVEGSYICGNNGVVLRDSSGNWVRDHVNTAVDLRSINPDFGRGVFIGGRSGTIIARRNNSWSLLSTGINSDVIEMNFTYGFLEGAIYAAGEYGRIIRSINSGDTWSEIISSSTDKINSICFLDRYSGWFVCDNGRIYKTSNAVRYQAAINGNNVSANFEQNGLFNRESNYSHGGFEWPRGSAKYARYVSSFLIGAVVNNETLVVCSDYSGEMLAGKTGVKGYPIGKEDPAYRIYKLINGVNDLDRAKWPSTFLQNSDQGAPVYFNQLINQWEPNDFGNQTMFFRMTDSYPESHDNNGGSSFPLNADVKVINYCFNYGDVLKDVLYSHFEIINQSQEVWQSAYFTFWSDDDENESVGKVGCDTTLELGYSYNKNNSNPAYGNNPPAVGFKIIRGANSYTGNPDDTVGYYMGKVKFVRSGYKTKDMYSFNWFSDDGPYNTKVTYECMSGLEFWNRGPIITPQGDTTRYYFAGDPESGVGWNQSYPAYRRTFTTTGPVNVLPGDTQHIVVAQVIAAGSNYLNSVTKLKQKAASSQQFYDNYFANVPIGLTNSDLLLPYSYELEQNFPNPFNAGTVISFSLPLKSFVTLKIFDLLGREITTLLSKDLPPGKYRFGFSPDTYGLSSGAYFYIISAGEFRKSLRMIVLK
ncbi:MAG: T9SS type A sorting domain-containing protein [Ignavibacteria bacterium]|nr:T9SS type A sorting domain-containing protein [Ignavibacteria bacterium]